MECENKITVVSGCLLSREAVVESSGLDDILDSLLCSQIFASKEAVKFDTPADWLKVHDAAMIKMMWKLDEASSLPIKPADGIITISQLVERKILSKFPIGPAAEVQKMMSSIAASQNDAANALFHQHVVQAGPDKASTVVLQISYLGPRLKLYTFYLTFKTSAVIGGDLFGQSFSNLDIVDMILRFDERTWDPVRYKKVRDQVKSFLKDKRIGLILPVSCVLPEPEPEPEPEPGPSTEDQGEHDERRIL